MAVEARAADAAKVKATAERPDEARFFTPTNTTGTGNGSRFFQRGTVTIVFIAKDFSRFSDLVARLRREQAVELVPVSTGAAGLKQLKDKRPDLVIVDEELDDMSGIEFVKQLVMVNPLANTAIVGSLPEDEFHEATEGLGVLMQLPPRPREADAESLLAVLAKISGLIPTGPQEAGR